MWYVCWMIARRVFVPGCKYLTCRLFISKRVSVDFTERGVTCLGREVVCLSLTLVDKHKTPLSLMERMYLDNGCPLGNDFRCLAAWMASGKSCCWAMVTLHSSEVRLGDLHLWCADSRQFLMNRRVHEYIRMRWWDDENESQKNDGGCDEARMIAFMSSSWDGWMDCGLTSHG